MPKSQNQKTKILILEQLLTGTGEENAVSMQEILRILAEHGISAERKSIYDDMEALRDFGYEITYKRGRNGGYYVTGYPEGMKEAEDSVSSEDPAPAVFPRICEEELSSPDKNMKLVYPASAAQDVEAYFGSLGTYKQKASGSYSAVVPRLEGPCFYGWMVSMGGQVHIRKPKKTAAAYRDYLKTLTKEYRGL